MLDEIFFDTAPRPVSKLIFEAENWIIQRAAADIARTGELSKTSEYRLSLLKTTRQFNTDYKKKIAKLAKLTQQEVENIFTEAAKRAYHYDEDLFTQAGVAFIPFAENKVLQQFIRSAVKQTNGELVNLTRTTALKMISPISKQPETIPQVFKQTLSQVTTNVAMGVEDYDSAIKRTVKQLAAQGVTVVRYEGEDKRPVNRSIESVVRANVLTGVAQLAGQVSMHNVELLGAKHVLVSSHNGARVGGKEKGSNHQKWQGRVHSLIKGDKEYPNFEEETAYGEVWGILGVHCRHTFSAYLPGISMPPPTEAELQAQHERDIATTHYKWKDSRGVEHERDFTYRDALDRQRVLERRMRDTRKTAKAFQAAGQDEEYARYKARYKAQRKEYADFSEAMKIDKQWERVYMDGIGKL